MPASGLDQLWRSSNSDDELLDRLEDSLIN
jgi:hypothetical protein